MKSIKSGIILAGGTGSRLAPLNTLFNKHLVPVYNRFVIDYPLDTLQHIGVKDLTVVLGGAHFSQIVSHIKDGSSRGMSANYVYQEKAIGIAQAINLCERFVDDQFVVILGDNIFERPISFSDSPKAAQIVLHKHPELTRFGVASLTLDRYQEGYEIDSVEEKPKVLRKDTYNYAITGCYLFDHRFFEFFKETVPSARGEYEITDIIKMYKEQDELGFTFADGMWSDAGTHESINHLNNFFYGR